MRKIFRIVLAVLIAGIVILQFFQPDRNPGGYDPVKDSVIITGVSEEIATILTTSCYDCHSNHTQYPWYGHVSPVSWFLEDHIRDGKDAFNFNQWGSLDKAKKIGVLTDICDEIESGSMPLKSYLLIHRDAKLSEADRKTLCDWTESEALKLLRE